MNFTFLIGISLGMLAALLINVGKGVQKQHVEIFKFGRKMFAKPQRPLLFGWLIGLAMTATASVPYSLGIKLSESPSAISAMNGIGLIGLVIYALKVLKEKISPSDSVGILLVILGTTFLGYLGAGREAVERVFSDAVVIRSLVILIGVAVAGCLLSLKFKRIHGVAWGLSAGMCIGLALFLADTALIRSGGDMVGQFNTPHVYAALVFGTLATVVTQIGFLGGRALEVVPAVNSAIILTPLVMEGMVYAMYPNVLNLVVIAVICSGVIMLSIGAAAKVQS